MDPLNDEDRQLLTFEGQGWRFESAKTAAIKQTFGLTPTAYYQRLQAVLDKPEALATEPVLVNRLRRLRYSVGGPAQPVNCDDHPTPSGGSVRAGVRHSRQRLAGDGPVRGAVPVPGHSDQRCCDGDHPSRWRTRHERWG